jgi:hypothetical protein
MEENKFENIEGIEHLEERNENERKAIEIAIKEELKENRKVIIAPIKEHYDILSIGNNSEDIKYIEVKAHRKPTFHIELSSSQFNLAKEMKEKFWIYLICNINKKPKIFEIQNPIENLLFIKAKNKKLFSKKGKYKWKRFLMKK